MTHCKVKPKFLSSTASLEVIYPTATDDWVKKELWNVANHESVKEYTAFLCLPPSSPPTYLWQQFLRAGCSLCPSSGSHPLLPAWEQEPGTSTQGWHTATHNFRNQKKMKIVLIFQSKTWEPETMTPKVRITIQGPKHFMVFLQELHKKLGSLEELSSQSNYSSSREKMNRNPPKTIL